jgi:hypothetical protein
LRSQAVHGAKVPRVFTNRPNGRTVCNIGEWRVPLDVQQKAIDIDWMTLPELSQAVPPAYTEFIGKQLMEVVSASRTELQSV